MHPHHLIVSAAVVTALSAFAQQGGPSGRANRPDAGTPIVLASDKLEFTISPMGGRFLKLQLRGGDPMNPFHSLGHFLALDGFGAPSPQEKAAGMPFHGEASTQPVRVLSTQTAGPVHSVVFESTLPLAQEKLTRTIELRDGESVVYVATELESELNVDRPVSWAEHATIGPPFLAPGETFVDIPATHCRVRPYKPGPIPGHLVYDRDFMWPMAPNGDLEQTDIRGVPTGEKTLDLASCEIDPARTLAFVTALNVEKRLLFGYVFPRRDYPWVMSWMNFTGDARAARGMEFSTQPFDVSHRETVEMNPLFGTPTFKWLPARSKIQSHFLIFYFSVPEGFTRVDDVTLRNGKLTIVDHASGKEIVLAAGKSL